MHALCWCHIPTCLQCLAAPCVGGCRANPFTSSPPWLPLQVPQLNPMGPVQVYPRKQSGSSSSKQGDSSRRELFVYNLGLSVSRDAVGKHFQQ